MKISYNWLRELVKLNVDADELARRLTMIGFAVDAIEESGDDRVLDIDLTSNRPDALSHIGIAREAALALGSELTGPEIKLVESAAATSDVASVEILDPDLCPRYAARVVRGVRVGPSPDWLARRLESIGQRPVNNIADVTNFVMFEMGQPTHAFDLARLADRRITVRRARAGERITTLDGVERVLDPERLVIADAVRPVAVAGVMGGEDSEIGPDTTDVLIESAYFDPVSVRRSARALGLDTEASYRFERGADPEAQVRAADRVAGLIAELTGGEVLKGALDAHPAPVVRAPVSLRESRIERVTSLKVEIEEAARILRSLEFSVEVRPDERSLVAVPPPFRHDVSREEDLIEEVARHTGYELIEPTLPPWTGSGAPVPGDARRRRARQALRGLGFAEAIGFSFVNAERDAPFSRWPDRTLKLLNPIDANADQMRTALLTGLLDAMHHNFSHGSRDLALFEIGRVFEAGASRGERPVEHEMLGLVLGGGTAAGVWRGGREYDFYDLKGAVETVMSALGVSGFTIERASVEYLHPGQSATLSRDGVSLARFGRLHARVASTYKFRQPVFVGEIELGSLLDQPVAAVRYSPLPRLPSVSRDVSALLPESAMWSEIERAVMALGIPEIRDVRVFDMYRGKGTGEGMRSLAFRVTYRADDRTLTDEEVTRLHEGVREMLRKRFSAELR